MRKNAFSQGGASLTLGCDREPRCGSSGTGGAPVDRREFMGGAPVDRREFMGGAPVDRREFMGGMPVDCRKSMSGTLSRKLMSGTLSRKSMSGTLSRKSMSGTLSRKSMSGTLNRKLMGGMPMPLHAHFQSLLEAFSHTLQNYPDPSYPDPSYPDTSLTTSTVFVPPNAKLFLTKTWMRRRSTCRTNHTPPQSSPGVSRFRVGSR